MIALTEPALEPAARKALRKKKRDQRRPLHIESLEARIAPATLIGLNNSNQLLTFDSASPGTLAQITVTGLGAGEILVGIDSRPATGALYGLTVDGGNAGRVYVINSSTGAATFSALLMADPTDTVDGNAPYTSLSGTNFGVDFNPVPDRMRVVSDTNQNLRINVDTGLVFTDGALNPSNQVGGAAYLNSFAGASSTTLFDISVSGDILLVQNPPNNGTLAAVGTGLGIGDVTGVAGFDIVSSRSAAGAITNTGFAALTVGGTTGLYQIDLSSGTAAIVGTISDGSTSLRGLTAVMGAPSANAFTVDSSNNHLIRFNTATPSATPADVGAITGLGGGESIIGFDFRPADGQLYLVTKNSSNAGAIYTVNTATGVATLLGTIAADPIDSSSPYTTLSGTNFGVDFNPVADRLRIVSDAGQSLRVNVSTLLVTTDANLNPGTPSITAAAYTNNFAGATGTTLFDIDTNTDQLATQNPPNNGTLVPVGSLGVDATAVNGFDIRTNGEAFATLSVGGVAGLYRINLTTGAATLVGAVNGVIADTLGLALAPSGSLQFSAATVSVGENAGSATLTINRVGGSDGTVSVLVNTSNGTAIAGSDYTRFSRSVTFGPGVTSQNISIPIFDDALSESGETFTVSLSDPAGGVALNTIQNATVTISDNDPVDLGITVMGPASTVVAGSGAENLTFTYTVTNVGVTDATNVSISELFTLPAGVTLADAIPGVGFFMGSNTSGTWDQFNLAKGASATLTVNFTADHTVANGANATVSGTITSTDGVQVNSENDSANAMGTIIRRSDLSLTKSDSPDPVGPGATLTYTITVFNAGPSDNTFANITDLLPAGYSNATWNASVNGSPGVGGTGNVDVSAAIPAQGSLAVTVTGTVTAAANTSITNTASLISQEDTNSENNSDSETTFVGGVDLKLTKAGDVALLTPGSVIKYTLSYRNGGFITANGTNITDAIPANTVFDLVDSTAGWQDSEGLTLADGAAAGTAIKFSLGSVPVSQTSASVILAVKVKATVAAGANTVDNTATIADNGAGGADLMPSDNMASASTTLAAAPDLVLSVVKNHFTASGQPLTVAESKNLIARGQELVYTYSFSNVGNQDATDATITAQVPIGTHFDFTDSNPGWSQTGPSTFEFDIASLPSGTSASTVIFAVDVNQFRTLGLKKIDSTATIDDAGANGPDPTPANNTATTSTTLYEGLYALSNSRQGGLFGLGSAPNVRVFDVTTGIEATKILAYQSTYRDGVRIAIGDVNGDGFDDIVTSTRSGTGRIRVFDGLTHERINFGELSQITAFTGRAAHGAYVALGDIDGDGRLDIIAGSGLGGGTVKVFSGVNGSLIGDAETPFGASYKGGIRVAGGDVNGDGRADIITGQGSYGSKVKVFFSGGEGAPGPLEFTTGAPRIRDGVFIAAADTTGDGIAEIIVGRGRAGNPDGASIGVFRIASQVDIFAERAPATGPTEIKTIPLSNSIYRYGARVAATDINFDGIADIVVGAGPLGHSRVQILDGVSGNDIIEPFSAFPSRPTLGVFTAAGAPPVPNRQT